MIISVIENWVIPKHNQARVEYNFAGMYSGNTQEKESSFAQMWKKDYRDLI